jgi:diadenosine tetraphosphatase ApaH/serine/threonine PP2A family protein phosphatase
MLIALFSDIHGNREAFEACLDHARRMRAEQFIFLGDYVGYGADPGFIVDAVERLVAEGAVALLGNHDAAVTGSDERMNPDARAAIRWTRTALSEHQRAFLAGLPLAHESDDRLYVHANAWAPADWDYVLGPMEAWRSMARTRCRVTFCGHVHVPALYHVSASGRVGSFTPVANVGVPLTRSRRWLVVLGSVGQPRDGDPAAAYALFHGEHSVLTVVRVPYDFDAAARKIREAGLPLRLAERLLEGR